MSGPFSFSAAIKAWRKELQADVDAEPHRVHIHYYDGI